MHTTRTCPSQPITRRCDAARHARRTTCCAAHDVRRGVQHGACGTHVVGAGRRHVRCADGELEHVARKLLTARVDELGLQASSDACAVQHQDATCTTSRQHQDAARSIMMQRATSRCNMEHQDTTCSIKMQRRILLVPSSSQTHSAEPHARDSTYYAALPAARATMVRCAAPRRACLQRSVPASRARRTGRAPGRRTRQSERYTAGWRRPPPRACASAAGPTDRSRAACEVGIRLSGNRPKWERA